MELLKQRGFTMSPEKNEKPVRVSNPSESILNKVSNVFDRLWTQVKSVNRETVIYVALAIGLILFILEPLVGGAIIGVIAGLVFSEEILGFAMNIKEAIEREEVFRGVVLGVLLLAFFLSAPMIVIGAAVTVAIKRLMNSSKF